MPADAAGARRYCGVVVWPFLSSPQARTDMSLAERCTFTTYVAESFGTTDIDASPIAFPSAPAVNGF
jgi:hypothetical protein